MDSQVGTANLKWPHHYSYAVKFSYEIEMLVINTWSYKIIKVSYMPINCFCFHLASLGSGIGVGK